MGTYIKRPVSIEAEQFVEGMPLPFAEKIVHKDEQSGQFFVITTHDQRAYLDNNDWVILEEKEGRAYPCKPDIFAKIYASPNMMFTIHREALGKIFKNNSETKESYVNAIATVIREHYENGSDTRTEVASKILDRIFD